ncbi:hypothetical protein ABQE46_21370 [Mycobacteroides chelonae]
MMFVQLRIHTPEAMPHAGAREAADPSGICLASARPTPRAMG